MDREDIERLFSKHFGRKPLSTPLDSQEVEVHSDPDLSEKEDAVPYIEQLSRNYLVTQPIVDEDNKVLNRPVSAGTCLLSDSDKDLANIKRFRQNGCGCKRNCISQFTDKEICEHIISLKEMEKHDKEVYIMATVDGTSDKEVTKRGKKRKRGHHDFTLLGKQVCKPMFMLAFDVKRTVLQNLMRHVDEKGVVHRVHGNIGRKPSKSLQYEDIKYVVAFITNTAEEIGSTQSAAPRGSDNLPPVYLPCETTKLGIHQNYVSSCQESDPPLRQVHYTSFCNIWTQCLPHIKIATPKDDITAIHKKLRKETIDPVTEKEKLSSTENLRNHIVKVESDINEYIQCITSASENEDSDRSDKYVHYTFGFSQNLANPHHSTQMDPLLLTTPRKVQIFGFRNDSIPRQMNFIIDENVTIGPDGAETHEPNAVISMIHWALDNNNSDETCCSIHTDEYTDQNKNQYIIWYFMWRVMTGRQRMIEYQMQVPGHTQCHVDTGFSAIKRLHEQTDTDCIDQLEQVINMSSSTNQCVRYPAWSWRDWESFLQPCFKPLKEIRKYQYFRFSRTQPGIVMVKESCDDDEQSIDIRISPDLTFSNDVLPEEILPGEISPRSSEISV